MQAVYRGSNDYQRIVRKRVYKADLQTMDRLRDLLVTLAYEEFSGREGRDWAIRQNPRGYLIPVYVANVHSGDTITIE
jgi:hypothetical protein